LPACAGFCAATLAAACCGRFPDITYARRRNARLPGFFCLVFVLPPFRRLPSRIALSPRAIVRFRVLHSCHHAYLLVHLLPRILRLHAFVTTSTFCILACLLCYRACAITALLLPGYLASCRTRLSPFFTACAAATAFCTAPASRLDRASLGFRSAARHCAPLSRPAPLHRAITHCRFHTALRMPCHTCFCTPLPLTASRLLLHALRHWVLTLLLTPPCQHPNRTRITPYYWVTAAALLLPPCWIRVPLRSLPARFLSLVPLLPALLPASAAYSCCIRSSMCLFYLHAFGFDFLPADSCAVHYMPAYLPAATTGAAIFSRCATLAVITYTLMILFLLSYRLRRT